MRISKKGAASIVFITNIGLEVTYVTGLVSGPTFRRIFELSDTRLGVALGAWSIGTLLFSPLTGHITQKRGPFFTQILGLICQISSILLVIFARGFLPLLIGLAANGVAASLIVNANSTYLAEWFPHNLRRIMSLSAGIWFASSALSAPGIGAWLQYANRIEMGAWSYRIPYCMDAVILAACLSLGLVFLRPFKNGNEADSKRISEASVDKSASRRPKDWEWMWIPTLGLLHGLFVMVFMAWVNPMIQEKFLVEEFKGSLMLGIFAGGLAVGRILLWLFKPDIDERIILAVSGIAGAICLTISIFAPSYGISMASIAIGGLVGSATYPCILSLVGTRFPLTRAKIYGYMHSSVALAGLTGPPIVGALADAGVPVWWALALVPVSGGLLAGSSLIWLRSRPARPGQAI